MPYFIAPSITKNLPGLWSEGSPNSRERPIHKTLLPHVGILECLNLEGVPQGEYFLSAPPIPLEGATESPTAPVLYTREEVRF